GDQGPAVVGFDAHSGTGEARVPGNHVGDAVDLARVRTVVIAQHPQHHAIEVTDLEPSVHTGAVVELHEGLRALQRRHPRLPNPPEQRRLPVTERKAVARERHACPVVPAEYTSGHPYIEIVAAVSAEPLELPLHADGAYLHCEPGVDGREGQAVGRFPAGGAVLERDGRVETPGLQAKTVARKGIWAKQ